MTFDVWIIIEQRDDDDDAAPGSTSEVFSTKVDTFDTLADATAFIENLEYNA
jgi:hypothetical protein